MLIIETELRLLKHCCQSYSSDHVIVMHACAACIKSRGQSCTSDSLSQASTYGCCCSKRMQIIINILWAACSLSGRTILIFLWVEPCLTCYSALTALCMFVEQLYVTDIHFSSLDRLNHPSILIG